jgi:NAD(P)H-dependent flavin oxidoreductase YrpB (nitropropane dioxygenase family)
VLDDGGEPVYGPRDAADLEALSRSGLPFWLAGGWATPEGLRAAHEAGAQGVQGGTVFALSAESGLSTPLRESMLRAAGRRQLQVRTEPKASPTGFPFKVVQMPGTVADDAVRNGRERNCDLGYLRLMYQREDGSIGQRCPAEPVAAYVRKGGDASDTDGRYCLCNGLTASAGIAQVRADGSEEPPLLTLGHDLEPVRRLQALHPQGWGAADVMRWLHAEPEPAPCDYVSAGAGGINDSAAASS